MNLTGRLPALRLARGGPRAEAAEESRLLKLYWNRAELKKELADLDQRLYELRDRLKQQEAATGRVAEDLNALEVLLGNPDYGFAALAHYQLRALWRACHLQLDQFASGLVRQREERERRLQVAGHQRDRADALRALAEREAVARAELAEANARVAADLARHEALRGFWNHFRRRRLIAAADATREEVAARAQALSVLHEERRRIEHETWPEFTGLSVAGKRSINLAVIAYAQLLVERLAATGLVARAIAAQHQGVQAADYGTRADCERLMGDVAAGLQRVRDTTRIADELKERSERLRLVATYPDDADAVPLGESLAPALRAGDPCVLQDNYWDVYQVLRG